MPSRGRQRPTPSTPGAWCVIPLLAELRQVSLRRTPAVVVVAMVRRPVSGILWAPKRPVTIHLCGLPEGVQLPGRTGRSSPLLGLAPGGVYRAGDVAVAAGALLPHRFTLTCDQLAVKRTSPSAVSLCCTCPSGRPDLAFASTLPCGVPTFLDGAARTAAITRPPHHCVYECTTVRAVRSASARSTISRPRGRRR